MNIKLIKTEFLAGLTTFLTASYVIFVNPQILSHAGMDQHALFTVTCLVTAIASFLIGFFADFPVLIAPSMGMNAYFSYTIVERMGVPWPEALSAVLISGLLFFMVSVLGARKFIIEIIPHSIKIAICAGIGLFLGFLGLKNAGFIVADPETLVRLGNLHDPAVILFFIGFLLIVTFEWFKVPGAILLGILSVSILGLFFHQTQFDGFFSFPPSLKPLFFHFSFQGFWHLQFWVIAITFFFAAFFDAVGTLIALSAQLGWSDQENETKHIENALKIGGLTTAIASFFGSSPLGVYIESSAGIRAGGTTGLTAIFTGLFFLIALFLAPLASFIPPYATAAALLYVACLILKNLIDIQWDDSLESIPAIITFITIPLTFSIANGICLGLITSVVLYLFTTNLNKIHLVNIILAVLSLLYLLSL